ncbi:MAG: Gfo/Idh/MocA family oxidoreductase [Alphaproteobacteria bacterium]
MLRAASIGLGWWSDELAHAVQGSSDRIRIDSCYSRSAEKRQKFAAGFGTRSHDSYEAVLADPAIDAVLLTTPHSLHGAHARQAAAAGKHVFVEKPFTLTLADAQATIAACRAAGVVLAVGHNRRLAPATRKLKEMIEAGELGTVLHAEAQFSVPGALGYKEGFWRASRAESPGGGMTGLGIHMVDAIAHLLGPVARVCAFSKRQAAPVDIDDTTVAIMECANGRTAYLGTIFATQPTRFLNVYGTRAAAHATDDLRVLHLRGGNTPLAPVALDPACPPLADPFAIQRDLLRMELDAFADAVGGVAPYPILPEEAAHNVAVMEAILASAARGGAPQPVAEHG